MKKGEVTSTQLVIIIVAVIGFALVLLFIFLYPWGGQIDKETCHQSVVLRSTFNLGPVQGSKIIPLRCRTEKICLTASGEDCSVLGKDSKKNSIRKVNIDSKGDILSEIADSMYDCNWMLGEGKLDFMPHEFTGKNYCLICSRFVLDDEAREKFKEIGYGELYEYLQKNTKTPTGNYLSDIYPGWEDWTASKDFFKNLTEKSKNEELKKLTFEEWKMHLDAPEGYVVVAQMTPKGTWGSWTAAGVIAIEVIAGTVLITTGLGAPAGIGLITAATSAGVATGGAVFLYEHPNGKFTYSPPTIYPYSVDALNGLGCYSFETAP